MCESAYVYNHTQVVCDAQVSSVSQVNAIISIEGINTSFSLNYSGVCVFVCICVRAS